MKFIPSGGWKIVIIIALAALVWGGVKGLWTDNKQLRTTNVSQSQTLEDVGKTQAESEKSSAVTENSVTQTVSVVTKLVVDQKAIDEEVARRELAIRTEYDNRPSTDENAELRTDAISRTRLRGLWDTYCSGGDQNAIGCPK